MASKSKRRRRVLGASCILAALIVAGSSFAWFTSKDEVTNRLTANSDYGVSIVESFIPPQNMIPGESVNKDVYAVNTGSMDAFVKETVSGILNYTFESRVRTWDKDCIKLDPSDVTPIDGATMNEGGAFLAWTSANTPTGVIRSERFDDATADRWPPPETGVYIFRRTIETNDANDPTVTFDNPKYTYAGYYFVKAGDKPGVTEDTYYKIVIGNDTYRADETQTENDGTKRFIFDINVPQDKVVKASDGTAVTIGANGLIEDEPQVYFVKDTKVDNADVDLIYYAKNEVDTTDGMYGDGQATENPYNAPYLAVRYNHLSGDVGTTQAALDAALQTQTNKENAVTSAENDLKEKQKAFALLSADLADKQVALENALGAYNSAQSRYDQTRLDYEYAQELTRETNTLYAAAVARTKAEWKKTDLETKLNNAITAVDDEVGKPDVTPEAPTEGLKKDYEALLNLGDGAASQGIAPTDIVPSDVVTAIEATPEGSLGDVKDNWTGLKEKWNEVKSYIPKIKAQLDAIDAISTSSVPGETTDDVATKDTIYAHYNKLLNELDALSTCLQQYANSYTSLSTKLKESSLTNIIEGTTETTNREKIYGGANSVNTLLVQALKTDASDTANDSVDSLVELIAAYKTAYENYHNYVDGDVSTPGTYANDSKKWTDAVSTYNTNVTEDRNNYLSDSTGVNKTQPIPNAFVNSLATDVPGYRAEGTLANDGHDIVNDFSANKKYDGINPADATDTIKDYPTIPANSSWQDFVTSYNYSATTEDASVTALPDITSKVTGNPFVTDSSSANYETDFVQYNVSYTDDEIDADKAANGDSQTTATTTPQTVAALKGKANTAQSNYNAALTAYDTANNTAVKNARDALRAAERALQTAEDEKAEADAAVISAQNERNLAAAASNIRFDVVLDADAEDNWEYKNPSTSNPLTYKEADFYYKHILEDGETSAKLIDSVKFLSSVSANDYKELTFDLNVDLDSAQVTYADDQKTPTATAVEGNAVAFQKTVDTITEDTANNEYDVTWKDRT